MSNLSAKLPLANEPAKAFADAGVTGGQGFKTSKVFDGYLVPGTMWDLANNQLQSMNLMKHDFGQVADTLATSNDKAAEQLTKSIPDVSDLTNDKDNQHLAEP